MNFFCCSLYEDLSDNLTETRLELSLHCMEILSIFFENENLSEISTFTIVSVEITCI